MDKKDVDRPRLKDKKTELQVKFGELLRAKRLSLGWSQEKLADEASLHYTYVASTERGERNISLANIKRLAEGLGCSMKDLMPY